MLKVICVKHFYSTFYACPFLNMYICYMYLYKKKEVYKKSLKGYAKLKVTSKCYVIYFLELKERPT